MVHHRHSVGYGSPQPPRRYVASIWTSAPDSFRPFRLVWAGGTISATCAQTASPDISRRPLLWPSCGQLLPEKRVERHTFNRQRATGRSNGFLSGRPSQHPDEQRPQCPVPLAVDQELGEFVGP